VSIKSGEDSVPVGAPVSSTLEGKEAKMLRMTIALLAVLLAGIAYGGEFVTSDPIRAFVRSEYPLGNDYFINGNQDTRIFRCVLTKQNYKFDGLALSEITIWGNRTGPWEIFKRQENGSFVYVETKHIADTSCLERCSTKEYLSSGQCTWERGWPKQ
jgi:hypothetical protein